MHQKTSQDKSHYHATARGIEATALVACSPTWLPKTATTNTIPE